MTADSVPATSTGLEYGEPLAPEELERQTRISERFRKDRLAFAAMREELLVKYDGEWISMYDGQLLHSLDPEDIFVQLRHAGIDPGEAFMRFLTSQELFHTHI